jgi:hypothetical protein
VIAAAGGDLAPQAAAPVIEAAVSLLAEIAAARA